MIFKIITAIVLICGIFMYCIILGVNKYKSPEEQERDDLEQMRAIKNIIKNKKILHIKTKKKLGG